MGWAHESHRELKSAVNNYTARINDPSLRWLFGLAEKFHRNFYNNTMPQFSKSTPTGTSWPFLYAGWWI